MSAPTRHEGARPTRRNCAERSGRAARGLDHAQRRPVRRGVRHRDDGRVHHRLRRPCLVHAERGARGRAGASRARPCPHRACTAPRLPRYVRFRTVGSRSRPAVRPVRGHVRCDPAASAAVGGKPHGPAAAGSSEPPERLRLPAAARSPEPAERLRLPTAARSPGARGPRAPCGPGGPHSSRDPRARHGVGGARAPGRPRAAHGPRAPGRPRAAHGSRGARAPGAARRSERHRHRRAVDRRGRGRPYRHPVRRRYDGERPAAARRPVGGRVHRTRADVLRRGSAGDPGGRQPCPHLG
ncbi:hypothetical protein M2164_002574 [Streptomyces sp. SAI-208]|nr:hypothetical protein [Streptomyces sp. SAI-208]